MIIYILNVLHKSIKRKRKNSDDTILQNSVMEDAKYISRFADIKKKNSISEINNKLTSIFEIIKKYGVSAADTFDVLEEVVGNKYNRWIIDEVYNYNGKYNIRDLVLSRYVGEILYSGESVSIDDIYQKAPNLRRVILDSVFNKIKENNRNNMIESLYDVS